MSGSVVVVVVLRCVYGAGKQACVGSGRQGGARPLVEEEVDELQLQQQQQKSLTCSCVRSIVSIVALRPVLFVMLDRGLINLFRRPQSAASGNFILWM